MTQLFKAQLFKAWVALSLLAQGVQLANAAPDDRGSLYATETASFHGSSLETTYTAGRISSDAAGFSSLASSPGGRGEHLRSKEAALLLSPLPSPRAVRKRPGGIQPLKFALLGLVLFTFLVAPLTLSVLHAAEQRQEGAEKGDSETPSKSGASRQQNATKALVPVSGQNQQKHT